MRRDRTTFAIEPIEQNHPPGLTASGYARPLVRPADIPAAVVVALESNGARTFIEFDSFGQVPAGTVSIDCGVEDWTSTLVPVRRRGTRESIFRVDCSKEPRTLITLIERDLKALHNADSLHDGDHLQPLKLQLESHVTSATLLEREPSFFDYSRYEMLRAHWQEALSAWQWKTPGGRTTTLKVDIDTLSEAMLQSYRDRFRRDHRETVARSVRAKLADRGFSQLAGILKAAAQSS